RPSGSCFIDRFASPVRICLFWMSLHHMFLFNINRGLSDIVSGFQHRHIWMLLAWLEIKQRYNRSKIGPFWLTISMGVMVAALGVIYGALFKMNLRDYLPMLAIGLVIWSFISLTITDGCNTYIASKIGRASCRGRV